VRRHPQGVIAVAGGVPRRADGRARGRWAGALLATLLALCACQSPTAPGPSTGPANAPSGRGDDVEAPLTSTGGSAVTGSAVLHQGRNGVDLNVWFGGVGPGVFRIAIHETGNCSSRNGFAAGKPYAPPGVPLAVVRLSKNDDSHVVSGSLPGYRLHGPDGLDGRAVVVHAGGSGSLDAEAGVPNDRIACGVIGTPVRFFPRLGF
jgi:superoxide dismutase, Cu-Zn family